MLVFIERKSVPISRKFIMESGFQMIIKFPNEPLQNVNPHNYGANSDESEFRIFFQIADKDYG